MLLGPSQTQQQIDWCNNDGNVFSVDQRLSGCTALVESERASAQDRAAGYGNRCWAYSDKGDPDRAITDCSEAIRLDPKLANAHLNRGKAYSDKGDFDRAIADYNRAIELNPKSSIAYNNLAMRILTKAITTGRLPIVTRRSGLIPHSPSPTATAATHTDTRARSVAPSPTIIRQSSSTQIFSSLSCSRTVKSRRGRASQGPGRHQSSKRTQS